ncbi:MAG TPA: hypothetical protein VH879_06955 [Gemmatimonadales bacterium]|jgi:class 3 adenylate cyclase
MPRFSPTRFPPDFFDLPADAGRDLPLDVIAAWTKSAQTRETAQELLAPRTLHGTVAASDSTGLTRLTQERSLIEIMAMVSRPKELVHAYGRAIGGQALGVWAADNTLMLYPPDLSADRVLGMVLAVLDQVRRECEVGIGICVHPGVFYQLGTGIYGTDAERVQAVAEDFTESGELVVTGELAAALGGRADFRLSPREDLRPAFGEIFRVEDGPRLSGIKVDDYHYPLPFSEEFFGGLAEFQRTRRTSVVPHPAFREAAVVVVDPEREEQDVPEIAVLNNLALAAALRRVGRRLAAERAGSEVKTSSGVSIYLFDDASRGVDFCRELRRMLGAQDVQLRIGMDVGRILLFELGPGLRDVAGSPVNVASKLAQDRGVLGAIQLTADAARLARIREALSTRTLAISGTSLAVVAI